MEGATADGDQLVIGYDKAKVKDAPQVDDDGDGHITPEEEDALYAYYGRSYTAQTSTESAPTGNGGAVGHDTSGPTTDDAMTRSEEKINVGTRTQEDRPRPPPQIRRHRAGLPDRPRFA